MKQQRLKRALDPRKDARLLLSLKSSAIEQRKRMLELGHNLRIKLHYGAMMSSVEILTTLYGYWMCYRTDQPNWTDRDRFVLSKGHAAPALYVTLALCGFFAEQELDGFRRLKSILQGHPDRTKTPGVDCTTGSLGQGFPVACGMSLGAKIDSAPYRIYSLISDGECNAGSVWEAALIASNLKLTNHVTLVDWNKKSSYGLMQGRNDIEPLVDKWQAFGWTALECDGHDFVSITEALNRAEDWQGTPVVLLCHTIKGKGIPWVETHHPGSNFFLEDEHYVEAMEHLNRLAAELKKDDDC